MKVTQAGPVGLMGERVIEQPWSVVTDGKMSPLFLLERPLPEPPLQALPPLGTNSGSTLRGEPVDRVALTADHPLIQVLADAILKRF